MDDYDKKIVSLVLPSKSKVTLLRKLQLPFGRIMLDQTVDRTIAVVYQR